MMDDRTIASAEGVILAYWSQGQGEPLARQAAKAMAAAQMLQSPETAAELARLREVTTVRAAGLSEAQIDALAEAGNQALAKDSHEDLCACDSWPQACVAGYSASEWETGAFHAGMAAVIGLWESVRASADAAELERLRSEVESSRVDGQRLIHAEQRSAELEAVLSTRRDDDRAEIERLRARVAELEAARVASPVGGERP